jgi:hypothetical protein
MTIRDNPVDVYNQEKGPVRGEQGREGVSGFPGLEERQTDE